jgi:hypothetical protein
MFLGFRKKVDKFSQIWNIIEGADLKVPSG